MQENNIMLSICCATYNHELYLRQALDSILMQKVNFKYEVIIADDCSTDGSQAIISEYADKYPNVFNAILRKKNVGIAENFSDIFDRTKGKYVIVLETDDFWTDEYKLQKQVDYLEANKNVIAVAHLCKVVDKTSREINVRYPQCNKKIYTLNMFMKWILPGQTTTIMYRNHYKKHGIIDDTSIKEASYLGPGDRAHVFHLMAYGSYHLGEIHCINEYMSAYRYVVDSGSSFSASNTLKKSDYVNYFNCYIEFAKKNKLPRQFYFVANALYLEYVIYSFLSGEYMVCEFLEKFKKADKKIIGLFYIAEHVLHKLYHKVAGFILGYDYL